MIFPIKNIFISCSLFFAFSLQANAQTRFPEKCIGKWQGTMYIFHQGKIRDSVDVLLHIKPINDTAWTWKTEYLSARQPMIKDYVLRHVGGNKYVTDEGEGIELMNYQFDQQLLSTFETEGILLTANYRLQNGSLYFEVTSGKKLQLGNNVTSYSIDNLQQVMLHRIP